MLANYPSTAEGICQMHYDALREFDQLDKGISVLGLEAWLVKNGAQAFTHTPRPDWLDRMTPNECFKNAYFLALEQDGLMTYYEGNVANARLPILIHHAWCVTEDGTVVDPTLPEDQLDDEATYYGVPVPLDDIHKVQLETEHYGVLHVEFGRELIERNYADGKH